MWPYTVFLEAPEEEKKRNAGKLGSSGLALHYANLINQIDGLVSALAFPANLNLTFK